MVVVVEVAEVGKAAGPLLCRKGRKFIMELLMLLITARYPRSLYRGRVAEAKRIALEGLCGSLI